MIITIIDYIVHSLQVPDLHCQLSRIQEYNGGGFSLYPAALSWILLLPWVYIAAGLEAVRAQISTEQTPRVPMALPLSSSHSGEAGDALGRAALSGCEDDVLCEMVEVTLLMREINCSNQSRNLREEMTVSPMNIWSWPKPCQKSVPAGKLSCDYYKESEWSLQSWCFRSSIKSSPDNFNIKCLEREGWFVKEDLVIPWNATMKTSGVWK